MRAVLYVLTFLSIIGLGFWAYRENYATQATLREVRSLQRDITSLREALQVQRAEWAWLNRPERLRQLVDLNFDRLGLLAMEPGQFGSVVQIPWPEPEIPAIDGPPALGADALDAVEAAVANAATSSEEGL